MLHFRRIPEINRPHRDCHLHLTMPVRGVRSPDGKPIAHIRGNCDVNEIRKVGWEYSAELSADLGIIETVVHNQPILTLEGGRIVRSPRTSKIKSVQIGRASCRERV